MARETHRAAPADPLKHTEVIVDGEMQKAKSPETADQAWTYTFIEGVASIIYVRVRGGGEVGSRDMKSAIDGDALLSSGSCIAVCMVASMGGTAGARGFLGAGGFLWAPTAS